MDNNLPPKTEPESDEVLNEFRNLGKNLKDILQSLWESEERKQLQNEIETGLKEMTDTLSKSVTEFSQSPTGQAIKSDINNLNERIRSGQLETQVRKEVVSVLRAANEGLKKATSPKEADTDPEEPPLK